MTTNKSAAIFFSLAIGLALGGAQVQAQTVDTGSVVDDPVKVDNDYVAEPAVQLEAIQEQEQVLEAVVEEEKAQVAVEEVAQEAELAAAQQEEEAAHDTTMNQAVSDHDAEMRAYLQSRGFVPK